MPIDSNGISVKTQDELITELSQKMRDIYGADISLNSDTPDGQMLMIYVQGYEDLQDLLVQIFDSMDPDQALGRVLDQRVAYNGIERNAGTYTVTPIEITTNRALTLAGLDQENPYTVEDDAGNEFYLVDTQAINGAGTYTFDFRAADIGRVLTTPNTITTPVTIVIGVTGVNNPNTYSQLGINEESDADLKTRRRRSTTIAATGYGDSLRALLENTEGVTFARVYQNRTSVTDSDGIPPHAIWVIIGGSPEEADVAQAIYTKLNPGVNMRGDESYDVPQLDGSFETVYWDLAVSEEVFVEVTLVPIDGESRPDIQRIRETLPELYTPTVGAPVNIGTLSTLVQSIDPVSVATQAGFSKTIGGTYQDILNPTTKKNQFVLTEENIILLPMQISPFNINIAQEDTRTFQAFGGYGDYTYSIAENNSGGSINSITGEYAAGTTDGIDTIRATDENGNFIETTATVF
tara:strand:- start:18368 stop:19759 length:1392 start_codon:yes stop_codon:yes gene_type:complete